MSTQNVLDILKSAILMEKRGKTFFESVAAQTKNEAVKEIFENMAEEEKGHIRFLSEHYKNVLKDGKFSPVEKPEEEDFSEEIITRKIKEQIQAASYEASAIHAAMLFEKQAVDFYSSEAEKATDPDAREVLTWLANWEKTHLGMLEKIDDELKQKVWNDNNFWPF
jgi:rubrerythrin